MVREELQSAHGNWQGAQIEPLNDFKGSQVMQEVESGWQLAQYCIWQVTHPPAGDLPLPKGQSRHSVLSRLQFMHVALMHGLHLSIALTP